MAAERRARAARVLACECDRAARPAVVDLLRGIGCEVTAHHSLDDTLREATEGEFDVIVASVAGADDECVRLLQLLRRARAATPLVIVTSDDSLEMRRRCQATRPYYYALRPLDPAELRTVIAGALEHGAAHR